MHKDRQVPPAQSGQVAVVVLLIMAVLLVLGLSLASQTTQEALISSQEEDTTRVFNAAETAVEEALSRLSKGESITADVPENVASTYLPPNTSATYTLTEDTTMSALITQGMSSTIFLPAPITTSFSIYWSTTTDCDSTGSLIISLYYTSGGVTKVKHAAVKPNGCYPSDSMKAVGFTDSTSVSGTYKFRYTTALNAAPWQLVAGDVPQLLRIKAVYEDVEFMMGGISLPSQMDIIRAEASDSQTGDGSQEQRAIEVTRTKPAAPVLFDYSLYSGGSLSK
jgi:Tfp pilus assembly protein PilX